MGPTLDIIIVNWNSGDFLRSCLQSITSALHESFTLLRVVVVDNASSDESLRGLDGLELPLTILSNRSNRGFGRACNQGALESRADYLLMLNPDTLLEADSLRIPLEWLERDANQSVAVAGIQLIDSNAGVALSCARFPRFATYFWTATGLDRLLPGLSLGYRMVEWDHSESRDVEHIMGAFYLVREAVFQALGGFDEDFFVYFEDIDLSQRIAARGHRSHFLAQAQAYHKGGGTTAQIPARRLACFLRGKLRYARKHHGRIGFLLVAALMVLVELPLRCLAFLVARRPKEALATLGAGVLLCVVEPSCDG
jgi:hypothetical protein